MAATKTQAFILKTQDYRDTSLLAHLYTRDFGKIHGVIKGIRDTRARFGSTLEPFSLNEILFYKRRRGAGDLHQVTQVELIDIFPKVRQDLERLSYASYFVETVDELVQNESSMPEIFDLLKNSLLFLSSGASCKRSARIFEIKLLENLGLMPQIRQCVLCQKEFPEPAYFSIAHGGIQCQNCLMEQGSGSKILVSRGTLNFFEHVQRSSDLVGLQNVKVAQGVGEELEKILRRLVDYQLDRQLKSMVFLEKMGY